MNIPLLLTLVLLWLNAGADPLCLTVADIDSLHCPPRDSLLARIHRQLSFDALSQRQQLHKALVACARLEALQQELAILYRQRKNLQIIHALNLEKQKRSEVSDLDVLQSEQNLLNKDMAIVGQVFQIKDTIIALCELANIQIRLQEHSP